MAGNFPAHVDAQQAFLAGDRGPALLVEPGSWGNLSGSKWMEEAASRAIKSGLDGQIKETQRKHPLKVSGVCKNDESASYDVHVPITLQTAEGRPITGGFEAAVIENSRLPALLGLKTLIDQRAILNFSDPDNLTMSFGGPGKTPIDYAPGTDIFLLQQAPTGHLMLPCAVHDIRNRKVTVPSTGYGFKQRTDDEDKMLALYREEKELWGRTILQNQTWLSFRTRS